MTKKDSQSYKWVLKGISFSVLQGESVGIVGMNGAGKSTLLKIITGTTRPSEGQVIFRGRVAALLELGMGFHSEFTGRQNIYMSGQLIGLSRAEVDEKMADIESFAEIGPAIDAPLRTYSSGMQMRLAFSIATAVRPDILIVDEALSVGDAYFQHKSFARIKSFKEQGTTLLFVSHDKGAIQTLCDRAILLCEGAVVMDGVPEAVMDYYNALIADKGKVVIEQSRLTDSDKVQTTSGSGEAKVVDLFMSNEKGERLEVLAAGERVVLHVVVRAFDDLSRLVLGYQIKDRLGQVMYGTNTYYTKQILEDVKGGQLIHYEIDFVANLGPGEYSVSTALVSTETHLVNNYEWKDLAMIFSVINIHHIYFVGCNLMGPQVRFHYE